MRVLKIVSVLILLILIGTRAMAVLINPGQGYTCISTSVTSSSVPVTVLAPQRTADWIIHVRSTPTSDPVLVFPYTGALPGSAPANAVIERPSGSDFTDQVTCSDPTCKFAIGQGWAAVLASGAAAITVDSCAR